MKKSTSFERKVAKKVPNHILCEIKRLYGVSNEACDDCKLHTSKLQTSHYTFAINPFYALLLPCRPLPKPLFALI